MIPEPLHAEPDCISDRPIEHLVVQTRVVPAKLQGEYEQRFGFIYIVFATGKSAEEMLALAAERLENDPDVELRTAAEEQRKITQLRLDKLLGG